MLSLEKGWFQIDIPSCFMDVVCVPRFFMDQETQSLLQAMLSPSAWQQHFHHHQAAAAAWSRLAWQQSPVPASR